MIPHITQERRAEDNIHHTGRIEGLWQTQKRCERMSGACDSLPDNARLSGLWGAGDEDAGPRRALPRRHDVRAEPHQSRERSFPVARARKINKQINVYLGERRENVVNRVCVCSFF